MKEPSLGVLVLKMAIQFEADILTARQKTRFICENLGFDGQDQIRIVTAVSELARNVFQYVGAGRIDFYFSNDRTQTLFIVVSDKGSGISDINNILSQNFKSPTGMGLGLMGAKKLMDIFEIQTNSADGTKVTIGKRLLSTAPLMNGDDLKKVIDANLSAVASNLNQELAETNRGVIALFAQLDERALSLKLANDALMLATAEADLANQAKSNFLSNMSHEIRTPLGIIKGFAELAMDQSISAIQRHDFLSTISRNSTNLTKLIGEILDLSKVEAGLIEIENAPVSIRDLVSEVVDSFKPKIQEKLITLSFVFDEAGPFIVNCDSFRLRQILVNVIGNALKFTSSGGISVAVKFQTDLSYPEQSIVKFLVKDTGIGLSTEQKSRLFQPFMQADSSTTRRFGGTGLGLSLSKKLAQAMGGDLLLVESELGVGSTFAITVKAEGKVVMNTIDSLCRFQENEFAPVYDGRLHGMNILLVEDSIDNQLLFSMYLTRVGAVVDVASDGLDGVLQARQKNYDVVLMDVQMPVLDGFAATSTLREEGYKVPIVALTAHAMKEDRDRALASGFSYYLIKPLDSKLLVETLIQIKEMLP